MDTKTTLSISQARKVIFSIAEKVQRPGAYYTLTEKGRPKAVVMSAQEFENWQETLEVMQEFPDLKKDIVETESAVKSGEYKSWTTLTTLLGREGFVVAENTPKRYAVPTTTKTKRAKRVR
ncbi:MAG: type II toxin-antitoxin system Phd/YefM family antitoxin [Patescibacteria group bacterium]